MFSKKQIKYLLVLFFLSMVCEPILAQQNKLKPTAESYFLEGNLLFNQSKLDEAMKKFKSAITLDNNMSQAYYNIGVIYQQKGKKYYNLAIKWYKQALRKNSKLIHAYFNLGVIFFDLGDYKNARIQFEIAHQLSPQDKSVLDALRITKKMLISLEEEKKKSGENENITQDTNKNPAKNNTTPDKNLKTKSKTENNTPTKLTPEINKKQTSSTTTTPKPQPDTSVLPKVKVKNVTPLKYNLAKLVTCKNVVNKNPTLETNNFSSKDKEIYLWMKFMDLNKKHNVATKWYTPSGKVFYTTSGIIEPAGGRYRYWVSKKLASTAMKNLKGKWKVEVLLDNQKIGETEFKIGN